MNQQYSYDDLQQCGTEELYTYAAACKEFLPGLKRNLQACRVRADQLESDGEYERSTDLRLDVLSISKQVMHYEQQVAWCNNIVKRRAAQDQLTLPGFYDDVPF